MTNTRSYTGGAAAHKTMTAVLITMAMLIAMIAMTAVHTYAAKPSAIEPGDLIEVGKADAEGYTGVPVWRVLDKKEDGSMLLMSEYLWRGNGIDNATTGVRFNNSTDSQRSTKVINGQLLQWRGTAAAIWADGDADEQETNNFYNKILANENGLIVLPTTKKIDEEYYYERASTGDKLHFDGSDPNNSVLYENKVFFLSAEEAVKYMRTPDERRAYMKGNDTAQPWLLRSTQYSTNWASEITMTGEITAVTANTGRAARPAFWAKFDDTVSFVSSTDDKTGRTLWAIGEDPEEEALNQARDEAIKKINSIDASQYSGDEKAAVEKAKADALDALASAKSAEEIESILNNAESQVSSQKTDEQKAAEDGRSGDNDETDTDQSESGDKNGNGKTDADAKARKVTTVTVNVPTVTARAIDKVVKAKGGNAKYVARIVLGKKVRKVKAKAFSKYKKVTTIEVRSKKLTKKSVKNALKDSKVKTIKVNVGKKAANKKYVKKYKKFFVKKNAGRKVTVK